MSFNIVIKVDGAGAESAIKRVGDALKDVEQSGHRAGDSAAEGGKKAHAAMTQLGEKLESIGKMGDQIKTAIGFEYLEKGAEFIKGVIEDYDRMADRYTEMANAAYKFASASHSVDDVIDEQISLAHELHSSLEATREIYDRVVEGTEGLNFTHQEQITLTKVLGEQVQLSNKPLAAATGLMERFSFALQTGTLDGRTFTMMLREFPGIAKLLEEHFGKTESELRSLVQQGRLGAAEIANALVAENGRSADAFKHHKQSIEEWKAEVVQDMDLFRARGADSFTAIRDAINAANEGTKDFRTEIEKASDAVNDLAEQTSKGRGIFGGVGAVESLKSIHALHDMGSAFSALPELITRGAYEAGKALDGLGVTSTKVELEYMTAIAHARQELEATNKAHADGVIPLEAYRKRWEALITTINGELPASYKIMREIDEPAEKFEKGLAGLNEDLSDGRINADQFAQKLNELAKAMGQPELHKPLDLTGLAGAAAGVTDVTTAQLKGASSSTITTGAEYQYGTDAQRKVADYRAELDQLATQRKVMNVTDDVYAQLQDNIRLKYIQIKTPAEELRLAQAALKVELDGTILTQEQYNAALAKTNAEYDHSALQGFKNALHALGDESKNVAKDVEQAFKNAFANLNTEIINFVENGKFDIGKLAKGIETDLLTMSLKQGEAGLINALGGSGGGSGSAALTGSAAALTGSAAALTAAAAALSSAALAAGVGQAVGITPGAGAALSALGGADATSGVDAAAAAGRTSPIVQIGSNGFGALLPALNTTAGRQQVVQINDSRTAIQKTLKAIRPSSR